MTTFYKASTWIAFIPFAIFGAVAIVAVICATYITLLKCLTCAACRKGKYDDQYMLFDFEKRTSEEDITKKYDEITLRNPSRTKEFMEFVNLNRKKDILKI